jgi:hypothetical protein
MARRRFALVARTEPALEELSSDLSRSGPAA